MRCHAVVYDKTDAYTGIDHGGARSVSL